MAVWTDFAALVASLASGKAFTDEKAQALAENTLAGLQCDATAPVNAACWHPYDMVLGNDGALGRFYNGTTEASVAAPTMEAGWDYAFRGEGLSHNNGSSTGFVINGVAAPGGVFSNSVTYNFYFEIVSPVTADFPKIAQSGIARRSDGGANVAFADPILFTNNATALTTFNFSFAAGSLDAGQLFMYRRRNYMGA